MRFIRLLFPATVLLLALPSAGQAQTRLYPPPNRNVICWQLGVKLRWKDFEARSYPASLSYPKNVRLSACCASEIKVLPYRDEKDKPTFLVESFFVKNKSWVRDSMCNDNKTVLAHEQLHFDINELFARKIRFKIAQQYEGIRPDYGLDLQDEIHCLLDEEGEFNQEFDQETHHDPSLWRLKKWQAIVARELAALEAYQSTASTCGQ